ncbi:MAG: hypothetical protein D6708_15020, partial [Candidatus Dadabacteria bacterium]
SDTEATFTPSGAGNVVLTAADAVGCTAATSVAVTACPAITVAASPADSPLKVYETYTLSASGGTGPYTWALTAGSGTLSGNQFTPDTVGDTVEITVTDANGCTGTWGGTVACPTPTVTISSPSDGATYGAVSGNTALAWRADPDDTIGTNDYDQIDRVEFSVSPDPGAGPFAGGATVTEHVYQYCGFGSNDCAANPGDVSAWADGTYTLTATAYTTCGTSASDSVTITIDNTACPSGTAIDGQTTETGSSISVLEVGLAESCTSTPEFKLEIKGSNIDWKFEVKPDHGSYKVKAENKDTGKKCEDSGLSLSDLVSLGILDVDTGLDLLGYQSAKDCSLAKALSANGGHSFTITVNKDSKYTNCSTPADTCGGWYRYAP